MAKRVIGRPGHEPGPPRNVVGNARAVNWLKERSVNNIIYIVGLVVVVIAVLSFFGLR